MHAKVKAAGLAGTITTAVVAILGACGVDVPTEVSAALTTVLSVVAGYLKVG